MSQISATLSIIIARKWVILISIIKRNSSTKIVFFPPYSIKKIYFSVQKNSRKSISQYDSLKGWLFILNLKTRAANMNHSSPFYFSNLNQSQGSKNESFKFFKILIILVLKQFKATNHKIKSKLNEALRLRIWIKFKKKQQTVKYDPFRS